MKKGLLFFFYFLAVTLYAQEKRLPEYIYIVPQKNEISLTSKNPFKYPIHIVIKNTLKKKQVKKVLYPSDSIPILTLPKKDFDRSIVANNYDFKRYFGKPFVKKYDTLYPYALPFKRGHQYKVIQGYNGRYTHKDTDSRYAIDFQMPVGDTVCAARKGVIIKTQDKYTKGGRNKKFKPYANFILIYHEDGTVTQYVHLKHKGVLVKPGDIVEKGQAIGLSGNTGWSTEPHLHFSVYIPKNGKLVSIPAMFHKVSGKKLRKGLRINY
jgi:murein DD-endopeptidase MepM/ murein hydrolase activator NlpD